jgi:hypothetical protein
MRFIIIIASFFMMGYNAFDRDWVAVIMWGGLYVLHLAFHIEDRLKEHIDKKFNELNDKQ